MNPKFNLLLAVLTAFVFIQCAGPKDNPDEYLDDNYANKLDIQSLIGNDHQFISIRVKNNRALVKASSKNSLEYVDSSFVLVIDLPTKKILKKIYNPGEPRSLAEVDIKGDSLFFLSHNDPEKIYIVNINTGQMNKIEVKYDFPIQPKAVRKDEITALDKIIMIELDETWNGCAIVNMATGQRTLNYKFHPSQFDISTQLNDTLNLYWSQTIVPDSVRFTAIDGSGKEIWNFWKKIPELSDQVKPVEIIRIDNRFIVKTDDQLCALDESTGKQYWNKVFPAKIVHAFFWNKKILIYEKGNPQQMNVQLIDPETGSVIWNKEFTIGDDMENLVPMKNELIISTENKFIVLNEKGEEKLNTGNTPGNSFLQYKMDETNGTHYLLYYRKAMLYW